MDIRFLCNAHSSNPSNPNPNSVDALIDATKIDTLFAYASHGS